MRNPTEMKEEVDEVGDRLVGATAGEAAACDALALGLDLDREPNFILGDGMICAFVCESDGPRAGGARRMGPLRTSCEANRFTNLFRISGGS